MVAKIFYRSWIQLLFISFVVYDQTKILSTSRGVNWPDFWPLGIRGGQKTQGMLSIRPVPRRPARSGQFFRRIFRFWWQIFSSENEPARAWGTNLNSMGCLKSNFDGFKKWVGWNDFKFFFSEIKSKSSGPRRSLRGFQTLAKRFFVGRFVVFFS